MNIHKDCWQLGLTALSAIIGGLCLFAPNFFPSHFAPLVSFFSIELAGLVIVFTIVLLFLLIIALGKYGATGKKHPRFPDIPERNSALFIVIFMFVTLVTAFAAIYVHFCAIHESGSGANLLTDPGDALYFSMVTITTVGYGDYVPSGIGRYIVVSELACGFLFLIMAVPILASRFADLSGKNGLTLIIRKEDDVFIIYDDFSKESTSIKSKDPDHEDGIKLSITRNFGCSAALNPKP